MTCFSIQKSLILVLGTLLFWGFCPSSGLAQQSDFKKDAGKIIDKNASAERRDKMQAAQDLKVDSPIVIELFTTSDCTACIYADRMLYDSMKDKNVIALSCHINDLNQLRSRDEMRNKDVKQPGGDKSSDNSPMDPCVFRQWTYAASRINRDVTISIPNFIFNGYDQVNAGAMSTYETVLNAYHYPSKNKVLEVFMQWKDDDTITINLPQAPNMDRTSLNASVWLIRYKNMAVQRIDEGINKGRVLRFSNIVQDIRHIAKWHGGVRSIDVDVPAPQGGKEKGGYAIIVAEMMGEPVLAAGKLVDYPTAADRKAAEDRAAGRSPSSADTPPAVTPPPTAPAPVQTPAPSNITP